MENLSGKRLLKAVCICDCGNNKEAWMKDIKYGTVKSCGCLHADVMKKKTIHGYLNTPTYFSWQNMKSRCLNSKNPHYHNYGGRGIKVCKRWYEFKNFLKDMGERPNNTTLDRINNNGDYKPSNCRWSSKQVQSSNKRTNVYLTYKNKVYTLAELSRHCGINQKALSKRLKRGWSVRKSVEKPLQKRIYV